MSPSLAILIVALLHVGLLAPLALPLWRPGAAIPVALAYTSLIGGAMTYQARLWDRPSVDTNVPEAASTAVDLTRCAEILGLLDRAGVLLERRQPPNLVVAAAPWGQLPQEAQDAVTACVQNSWPRTAPPVQVVTTNQTAASQPPSQ